VTDEDIQTALKRFGRAEERSEGAHLSGGWIECQNNEGLGRKGSRALNGTSAGNLDSIHCPET